MNGYTIDYRIVKNLIRKLIITRLNRLDIWTRQFYSKDIQKIFVVLKCGDRTLINRAKVDLYPKQLELGNVDLLSLEPVGKRFRPFRFKKPTFVEVLNQKALEIDPETDSKNKGKEKEELITVLPKPISTEMGEIMKTISTIKKAPDIQMETWLKGMYQFYPTLKGELKKLRSLLSVEKERGLRDVYGDFLVSREEMEHFYIYSSVLKHWHKIFYKMINKQAPTSEEGGKRGVNKFDFIAGFIYRLIFQKALGDTNRAFDKRERTFWRKIFCCHCSKKKYLMNIWDYMDTAPMAPFREYEKNDKFNVLWREYEINERKGRSRFKQTDRLKLLDNIMTESFNIQRLRMFGILDNTLVLHDNYILKGASKVELFEDFQEVAEDESSAEVQAVQQLLSGLTDNADPCDFIGDPLLVSLSCKLTNPAKINTGKILEYFGEKVGLFFEFTTFHCDRLRGIGYFGILIFIIDIVTTQVIGFKEGKGEKSAFERYANGESKASVLNAIAQSAYSDPALYIFKANRIILSIATVIWTTLYLEKWKLQEKQFATRYGTDNCEASEQLRTEFDGQFQRDISNNNFNKKFYPESKRNKVRIVSAIVIAITITLSVIVTLALLFLKTYLLKQGQNAIIVSGVPGILNFIAVKFFAFSYDYVAKYFNQRENHETLTQFEDSLISKMYLFSFLNTFNSYFIIGLLRYFDGEFSDNKSWDEEHSTFGRCVSADPNFMINLTCYDELQSQVRTFFILSFFLNFLEVIIPFVKQILRKPLQGFPRKYKWAKVDDLIEEEYLKEEYQTTVEIDGIMKDYLKIVTQFAAISLFGVAFPLAYALGFITVIAEIHIDKTKLLHFIRRPMPRAVQDIGSWKEIIEGISFLSIFINAALVCFTAESFISFHAIIFSEPVVDTYERKWALATKYCLMLTFLLLLIKKLTQVIYEKDTMGKATMSARHKFILENIFSVDKNSSVCTKAGLLCELQPHQVSRIIQNKLGMIDGELSKVDEDSGEEVEEGKDFVFDKEMFKVDDIEPPQIVSEVSPVVAPPMD